MTETVFYDTRVIEAESKAEAEELYWEHVDNGEVEEGERFAEVFIAHCQEEHADIASK